MPSAPPVPLPPLPVIPPVAAVPPVPSEPPRPPLPAPPPAPCVPPLAEVPPAPLPVPPSVRGTHGCSGWIISFRPLTAFPGLTLATVKNPVPTSQLIAGSSTLAVNITVPEMSDDR